MIRSQAYRAATLAALVASPFAPFSSAALAHGYAGARFFPATIATDDPFVSDELSLPTVSTIRSQDDPDSPAIRETDVSVDFSKRITRRFGIGIGETWEHFSAKGTPSISGFDNLAVSAKYLLIKNDPHEFLLSIGVDADVGRTGSQRLGVDQFSTITPGLFFGKGFGDLPDSVPFLRPLAITGVIGVGVPTRSQSPTDSGDFERHPRALNTGIAFEYSLPYLQANVRDVGLRPPFNHLIAIVELNFETPLNGDTRGETTGTVNPGLIWAGKYFQVAAEAIIPANDRSGHDVGAIAQLHFFLDDLFPTTIGKPIFGN